MLLDLAERGAQALSRPFAVQGRRLLGASRSIAWVELVLFGGSVSGFASSSSAASSIARRLTAPRRSREASMRASLASSSAERVGARRLRRCPISMLGTKPGTHGMFRPPGPRRLRTFQMRLQSRPALARFDLLVLDPLEQRFRHRTTQCSAESMAFGHLLGEFSTFHPGRLDPRHRDRGRADCKRSAGRPSRSARSAMSCFASGESAHPPCALAASIAGGPAFEIGGRWFQPAGLRSHGDHEAPVSSALASPWLTRLPSSSDALCGLRDRSSRHQARFWASTSADPASSARRRSSA